VPTLHRVSLVMRAVTGILGDPRLSTVGKLADAPGVPLKVLLWRAGP
jgi:hypothetical protein